MPITAAQVKELRDKTGAGMLDCKNALAETDGDMEKAIDWLREKGIAKSAKKAGRIAAEGLTKVLVDGNKAILVEINSETDFVAKNEQFLKLLDDTCKTIIASDAKDNDAALALAINGHTLADEFVNATATIGEKIVLRRFEVLTKSDAEVFGDYIDVYDMTQAVDDGATVPIMYESRMARVGLNQRILDDIDSKIDEIKREARESISADAEYHREKFEEFIEFLKQNNPYILDEFPIETIQQKYIKLFNY